MSQYVYLTCPGCGRSRMKVKGEYLGKAVRCKYCGHGFRAELPREGVERAGPGGLRERLQAIERERDEAVRARDEAAARVVALEVALHDAREALAQVQALGGAFEALRVERDRLQAEAGDRERTLASSEAEARSLRAALDEAAAARDRWKAEAERLRDEAPASALTPGGGNDVVRRVESRLNPAGAVLSAEPGPAAALPSPFPDLHAEAIDDLASDAEVLALAQQLDEARAEIARLRRRLEELGQDVS